MTGKTRYVQCPSFILTFPTTVKLHDLTLFLFCFYSWLVIWQIGLVAGIQTCKPKIGECRSSFVSSNPNLSFIFEPNHALHKRGRHNFWDKFHNSSHSGSAVVVVVKRRLAEAGQLQQPPLTLLTDGRRAHSEASGAYTVKVFGQGANSLSPHKAAPRAFSTNIFTTPLGFSAMLTFQLDNTKR